MITGRIELEDPVESGPMLRHLEAHAIPGSEVHEAGEARHSRVFATPDGPVAVTVTITDGRIMVEAEGEGEPEQEFVLAAVRQWLDLDADLASVRAALGGDPLIGPMIAARPGLRVVGYPDGFEGAVMTLLGQQVSLAAARTFGGRLVAAFGRPGPGGLSLFPEPERLAGVATEELRAAIGVTGARARTIRLVAGAFEDGLGLDPAVDRSEARRRLLAIPGVGPWTVEYLGVRALRDPDAFPGGDLVLRRVLGGITTREAESMSETWRPWRAYALFHLWTSGAFV
ncbi:MAG TPA: AlkA N-terminal domain-containing protein [Solirubrobacterales bacterium]|nr:AlkA N-terminal domain-containing protein [Solirubrobacterales bacterium]